MSLESDLGGSVPWTTDLPLPDWDTVYREQLPRIYNFFRYRTGHDTVAEDLAAATFEKAWRARHRYRRDLGSFTTWLLSIARNVAVDHARGARAHERLDAAEDLAAAGTPEEDAARRSNSARLGALLAELPERERDVIALKYGAGVTNRAIAELTGLTETNVGTIAHRAVQTLRGKW